MEPKLFTRVPAIFEYLQSSSILKCIKTDFKMKIQNRNYKQKKKSILEEKLSQTLPGRPSFLFFLPASHRVSQQPTPAQARPKSARSWPVPVWPSSFVVFINDASTASSGLSVRR